MSEKIKNIVLLGSGNVATHLGKRFKEKGFHVVQVYSKTLAHAKVLAEELGCTGTNKIQNVIREADLYILAVSDGVIHEISNSLEVSGLVVHTSGTAHVSVLRGNRQGVLYPLQTFSKARKVKWKNLPILIEASNEADEIQLKKVAKKLSGNITEMSSEERAWIHLAAVYVNNFSNLMLSEAESILKQKNLDFELLKPLALETMRKAFQLGASNSQTGPARRKDKSTITKHLSMLKELGKDASVYKKLSEEIGKLK